MDSEDDDFSAAVPRNTEILKNFRRAPPPKNRSKARRFLNKRVARKDEHLLDGSDVKEEDEDATDATMTSQSADDSRQQSTNGCIQKHNDNSSNADAASRSTHGNSVQSWRHETIDKAPPSADAPVTGNNQDRLISDNQTADDKQSLTSTTTAAAGTRTTAAETTHTKLAFNVRHPALHKAKSEDVTSAQQPVPLASRAWASQRNRADVSSNRQSTGATQQTKTSKLPTSIWRPRHTEFTRFNAPSAAAATSATSTTTGSSSSTPATGGYWSSQKSIDKTAALAATSSAASFKYEKYLIKPSEATQSFSDFGSCAGARKTTSGVSAAGGIRPWRYKALHNEQTPSRDINPTSVSETKDAARRNVSTTSENSLMSTSLPSAAFDVSKYFYRRHNRDGNENNADATNQDTNIARPKSYHQDQPSENLNSSSVNTRLSSTGGDCAEATFTDHGGTYSFYTPNPLGIELPSPTQSTTDDFLSPASSEPVFTTATVAAAVTSTPPAACEELTYKLNIQSAPANRPSPPKLSGFFTARPFISTYGPPHAVTAPTTSRDHPSRTSLSHGVHASQSYDSFGSMPHPAGSSQHAPVHGVVMHDPSLTDHAAAAAVPSDLVHIKRRLNFDDAPIAGHHHNNAHVQRSKSSVTPGGQRTQTDQRSDVVNRNHRHAYSRQHSFPATDDQSASDDADDYVTLKRNAIDNSATRDNDVHDYVNVDKFMKRLKEDISNDNFVWPSSLSAPSTSLSGPSTSHNDFALLGRNSTTTSAAASTVAAAKTTPPTAHRPPSNDNNNRTPIRRTSSIKFNVDFSATTV